MLRYPLDLLVSYHYFRTDQTMTPLVRDGKFRIIGDSGAFSAWSLGAKIDLAEYAEWCHRWWDHFCWCASLDVIGDPHTSWRNWLTLRDRYGLLTVPTLHAWADTSWLDAYAAEGVDLIGLGGMGRSPDALRAFRWAVHVLRHARRRWEHVRFHLWGVTRRQFLDVLPVWSADSSGILGGSFTYGVLRLFNPHTGRDVTIDISNSGTGRASYRHGELLRKVYGVDPSKVERSHSGNRTLLILLTATSTQQYAQWLQRRHHVTPPSMYRAVDVSNASGLLGPRIHVVSDLRDLIKLAAGEGMELE